ncbi:MAG: dTMP kinase [Pseudomonadota bacterium]
MIKPSRAFEAGQGCFITFEGGEGAGKSTQLNTLAETLRRRGLEVVTTREPGGTPEAEALRAILLTAENLDWKPLEEVLVIFAARHSHIRNVIKPALDNGAWVLCDRFTDSTRAYQGYGHGVDEHLIDALSQTAQLGVYPDLTLVLDVDVETGLTRARERRGDNNRYDAASAAFHQKVRNGFHAIAKRDPDRVRLVDASSEQETVAAAILDALGDFLPP